MSATFKGVHFLVEGDDDSKFWKQRISKEKTSIVCCEGRPNLLGVSVLLTRRGLTSVLGVYDADFDHLHGVTHSSNMLAPTDENDLEVTILASDAIGSVIAEYAEESLVEEFEKVEGASPVDYLERLCREFGQLRFLSRVQGHNVDFDRLSPYRFVSQDTWGLDRDALWKEYATFAGVSRPDLEAQLQASIPVTKQWGLCQGHDAVRILAQGFRKRIGRKQISEQDLAKILRIAYSNEMLRLSRMFATLHALENILKVKIF